MKIGTSFAVPKVSDLRELVPTAEPVAIVVGAFAHGSVSACVPYLTVKIFIGIDFSLVLSMGFFFCCSFFGLVLLIPPPPSPPQVNLLKKAQCCNAWDSSPSQERALVRASSCLLEKCCASLTNGDRWA